MLVQQLCSGSQRENHIVLRRIRRGDLQSEDLHGSPHARLAQDVCDLARCPRSGHGLRDLAGCLPVGRWILPSQLYHGHRRFVCHHRRHRDLIRPGPASESKPEPRPRDPAAQKVHHPHFAHGSDLHHRVLHLALGARQFRDWRGPQVHSRDLGGRGDLLILAVCAPLRGRPRCSLRAGRQHFPRQGRGRAPDGRLQTDPLESALPLQVLLPCLGFGGSDDEVVHPHDACVHFRDCVFLYRRARHLPRRKRHDHLEGPSDWRFDPDGCAILCHDRNGHILPHFPR
mmetsp:Transcript_78256/g.198935  ORF Transcript_78256/g.198935 Transcript_78256/m.198935 type:complete len:285 (-) Transcript_78256:703-1557(-)